MDSLSLLVVALDNKGNKTSKGGPRPIGYAWRSSVTDTPWDDVLTSEEELPATRTVLLRLRVGYEQDLGPYQDLLLQSRVCE